MAGHRAAASTPHTKEPILPFASAQGHARTLYTSINVEQNLATGDPEPGSLEQEMTEPQDGLGWEGPLAQPVPPLPRAGTPSPEQAAQSPCSPAWDTAGTGHPQPPWAARARASAPRGRISSLY